MKLIEVYEIYIHKKEKLQTYLDPRLGKHTTTTMAIHRVSCYRGEEKQAKEYDQPHFNLSCK